MRSATLPREPAGESALAGQMRLTTAGLTWLAVTVVLGGIGWFKSMNLVLVLAYFMAALLLTNCVVARANVRRITATCVSIPPLFTGEETRLIIRVANHGKRPASVTVIDPLVPGKDWFVDRLPAGHHCECAIRKSFTTRGRMVAAAPCAGSGFPFGLIWFEKPCSRINREVYVLPACGTADAEGLRSWLLRHGSGDGRARKVLRRLTSDATDVRGVRPFRTGDSLRAVHWRTTARRRELVVREYDSAPSPDLVVVVDPWLPLSASPAQRESLEAALSLAATIVRTWATAYSTRVTLAICSASESKAWSASGGEEFVRDTLIPLAEIRGTHAPRPPAPSIFDRSLAGSARVLVSSRPQSPLAEALAHTTGRPFVLIEPSHRLHWYEPPQV